METSVFEIELTDGRTFRIFCANGTQKRKFFWKKQELGDKVKTWHTITNGLHTMKQWNEISKDL